VCELRVVILRGWLWWSACWLAWCSGTVCTASAARTAMDRAAAPDPSDGSR
jgi:hypothetical protein